MKLMFMVLITMMPLTVQTGLRSAKTVKIAVLDTGLERWAADYVPLCSKGHASLDGKSPFVDDHVRKHGTNVVGIISKHARGKHCFIIIKVKDKLGNYRFTPGLLHAAKIGADIVNISGGGIQYIAEEKAAIDLLVKKNIKIVAAAGNRRMNLDKKCSYYPACLHKDVVVVGSTDTRYTNRGRIVDYYVNGTNVSGLGYTLSGTSQATAIITGKLIKVLQ